MKLFFPLVMVFILVPKTTWTMNDQAQENEPLCSCEVVPDEELYQQQVTKAIIAYQQSLQKSLGCCFKKTCAELFKTDKYQHVQKRLDFLEKVRVRTRSCNSLVALAHNLMIVMEEAKDVKSTGGSTFNKQCLNTLQALEHDLAEGQPDHVTCAICFDGRKVVACSPCMHLVYCGACYVRNLSSTTNCALCRQKIDAYLIIDEPCDGCHENLVTHIGDCGHPRYCAECYPKNASASCPTCGLRNIKWHKVY